MAQKANFSNRMADRLTTHGIALARHAVAIDEDLASLLDELDARLRALLMRGDATAWGKARIDQLIRDARARINETYDHLSEDYATAIGALAAAESEGVSEMMNSVAGIDITTGTLPRETLRNLTTETLIQGAPSAEWWARQGGDLSFRFASVLRTGIAAGDTTGDIVRRVMGDDKLPGIMNNARRNAETLVRTSVQEVANESRLEVYRANSDVIEGVQQISTLDERTSDICIAYDQASWDLDGNPINDTDPELDFDGGPPRHFNCRSVLIPITVSWKDLGLNADEIPDGTRASMDGEVSNGSSFSDWLGNRSKEVQDEVLGTGRAQLWRDGDITLSQLLDQRGRSLSLDQLQQRYGSG
jgi:hypothetical protein